MHVTSDYFRCRAQRATYMPEPSTLFAQSSCAADNISASNPPVPLIPSRRTLRDLENLYKNDRQNRIA
ncbi:hypothetical protein QEH59_09190 [Coraliomargarita sp. SDUM461004]|uniref:Uncharacterized protein n=1 Tax=Thalassobacterium sedimentorum TaxID=3041258 RepID=A0ABU1AIY5_9BACT|nr:hypothetical protein [Coraliomargarita sp. SDUM461004]